MNGKPYICIVGTAQSTTNKVPYHDPLAAVWGLGSAYQWIPTCAAWFEMHSDYTIDKMFGNYPGFYSFLEKLKVPILMTHKRKRFPTSEAFPLRAARKYFGIALFHSSFDYMLALAIMQIDAPNSPFRKEIRLYGIDMHMGEEWEVQLPSASFYLGWAMSRGIKVVIPDSSSLLHAVHRYGYDEEFTKMDAGDERIAELKATQDLRLNVALQAQIQKAQTDGALVEAEIWKRRGARF